MSKNRSEPTLPRGRTYFDFITAPIADRFGLLWGRNFCVSNILNISNYNSLSGYNSFHHSGCPLSHLANQAKIVFCHFTRLL